MNLTTLEQNFPHSPFEPMVPIDGTHLLWKEKKMLHFLRHDVLGLQQQNDLKKNAMKYLLQFGVGTSPSRHPKQALPCEIQLQDKLASMLGKEQSFFLPSRLAALTILLSTFAQSESIIFADEACDPFILKAIESVKCNVLHFQHNDIIHLAELIRTSSHLKPSSKIIITESVFGTNGNSAAIDDLALLADDSNSLFIVDDSLGFGSRGDDGLGLAAQCDGIDCILASLLPSCGIAAAFLACDQEIAEDLMQNYLFWHEHPVSIPTLGTIDAALEWIPQMEGERRQLEHRCHWLLLNLNKLGFPVHRSHGHVITLQDEGEHELQQLWNNLAEQEILCELIPGFPNRLSMTINILHTPEDLNRLYQALQIAIKEVHPSTQLT